MTEETNVVDMPTIDSYPLLDAWREAMKGRTLEDGEAEIIVAPAEPADHGAVQIYWKGEINGNDYGSGLSVADPPSPEFCAGVALQLQELFESARIAVTVKDLVSALNEAHDIIMEMQDVADPENCDWPEFSPQANAIQCAEALLDERLAKTTAWTLFHPDDEETERTTH